MSYKTAVVPNHNEIANAKKRRKNHINIVLGIGALIVGSLVIVSIVKGTFGLYVFLGGFVLAFLPCFIAHRIIVEYLPYTDPDKLIKEDVKSGIEQYLSEKDISPIRIIYYRMGCFALSEKRNIVVLCSYNEEDSNLEFAELQSDTLKITDIVVQSDNLITIDYVKFDRLFNSITNAEDRAAERNVLAEITGEGISKSSGAEQNIDGTVRDALIGAAIIAFFFISYTIGGSENQESIFSGVVAPIKVVLVSIVSLLGSGDSQTLALSNILDSTWGSGTSAYRTGFIIGSILVFVSVRYIASLAATLKKILD